MRVIAAKGFIPYYGDQYAKMYAQVFGFERQGLLMSQIDSNLLAEALVSNIIAAADHIFWAASSVSDDVMRLLCAGGHETLVTMEGVLNILDSYADKILRLEKDVLDDKKVMKQWKMKNIFSNGLSFTKEIPDRAYRNNPHWTNFHAHFKEQFQRVNYADNQWEFGLLASHSSLNTLILRLEQYRQSGD
jgi:hypothetical protein